METPEILAHQLLPILRQFCVGPCGVALGGAHAKGISDAHSDIDLYLFTEQALPGYERADLVRATLGAGSEPVSWGQDDPFEEGGTDFWYAGYRVEVWLRSAARVESTIAAARQGQIRRDMVVWATMGFFNYVVLADVNTMRIVEDPRGLLARWKEEVRTYPDALRDAILDRFLREARFWPENLHYKSAIQRADLIYTSGIVTQVLHALIQAAFALNREYFPGEKKLAQALERLNTRPDAFSRRVHALLFPGGSPTVGQLQEQQRELAGLVAEMERLVLRDGAGSAEPE